MPELLQAYFLYPVTAWATLENSVASGQRFRAISGVLYVMNHPITPTGDTGRPSRMARKVEMVANITILVVAVALCVFVFRHRTNRSADLYQPPAVGSRFGLADGNWQISNRTIVLGLSTTCHLCAESAPFYQRVVDACKREHVRVLAVLPQPVSQAESYLKSKNLIVNEVRQAALQDLKIKGTPTVVLVDKAGIVRDAWVGKLPPDEEKLVLDELGSQ